MLAFADSRALLRDAVARRLGGEVLDCKDELLPSPMGLSQVEKSAWLMLHNWASDQPLRANFASHATYCRNRLEHLFQQLQ